MQSIGEVLHNLQLHIREPHRNLFIECRRKGHGKTRRHAKGNRTVRVALRGRHIATELLKVAKDVCRTIKQYYGCFRRCSSPWMSLKELNTKLFLKQTNLTTKRRLGDVKDRCCTPKMSLLREN